MDCMGKDGGPPGARDELNQTAVRVTFAVIIACAFILRFFQLGAPTFWFDEMWTALISTKSLPYIVDYAKRLDQHPPLQNILFKLFSTALGRDDSAARLVYALSGVMTVGVVFKLGARFISPAAGLFSSCFLAVNYTHVWMSRTVRVYSLLVLCFSLAVYFMMKYHDTRKSTDYWLTAFFCLLISNLHFVGVILSFQIYCIIFMAIVRDRADGGKILPSLAWHSCTYLALALPSVCFLAFELSHKAVGTSLGSWDLSYFFTSLGRSVAYLTASFRDTPITAVVIAAMLAGALHLAFTDRRSLFLVGGFLVIPVALFLVSGYSSIIGFTYISFMLIPMSFLVGAFFDAALGKTPRSLARHVWIPLVALLTAVSWGFLQKNNEWLYVENNLQTRSIFPVGLYKQIARYVVRNVQGPFILFSNSFLRGGVSWYVSQLSGSNFIEYQRLDGDRRSAVLSYVYVNDDEDSRRFLDDLSSRGVDVAATTVPYVNIASASITRENLVIKGPVSSFQVSAAPYDTLRHAHELENMASEHVFGGLLFPTNYEGGKVEYWFENKLSSTDCTAYISIDYKNMTKAGRIDASYALDGGAFTEFFTAAKETAQGRFVWAIPIKGHFGTLKLRFKVFADPDAGTAGIENLNLVGLKSLRVHISDSDHADISYTEFLAGTLPQGVMSRPVAGQDILSRNALEYHPEGSSGFFTPSSGNLPGEVTVKTGGSAANQFFYPRVFGEQDVVSVYSVTGGVERHLLTMRGNGKAWTPLHMQVPLPQVEPAGHVRFRLHGHAQLWASNNNVVYLD